MKRMFAILLLLMIGLVANCYATDGDIYNDGYWRTTSTGVQRPISLTSGGQMPVIEVFATGDTLTAAESGKVCILDDTVGGGEKIFTLPTATAGLNFTFTTNTDSKIDIDPYGSERIWYLTLSAGDMAQSAGSTADSIKIVCGTTGYWSVVEMKGTWVDLN